MNIIGYTTTKKLGKKITPELYMIIYITEDIIRINIR